MKLFEVNEKGEGSLLPDDLPVSSLEGSLLLNSVIQLFAKIKANMNSP